MKFLRYLSMILLLCTVVACQSAEEIQYDELTPAEYQKLLKKVRIFITVAPANLNISQSDKRFVNTHEPKYYPYYMGDKSGEFKMSWKINPGYSIRVIGKGKFMDSSCLLRLTISRFAQ